MAKRQLQRAPLEQLEPSAKNSFEKTISAVLKGLEINRSPHLHEPLQASIAALALDLDRDTCPTRLGIQL